jgi:hypothetical protein
VKCPRRAQGCDETSYEVVGLKAEAFGANNIAVDELRASAEWTRSWSGHGETVADTGGLEQSREKTSPSGRAWDRGHPHLHFAGFAGSRLGVWRRGLEASLAAAAVGVGGRHAGAGGLHPTRVGTTGVH